jgi:PAS domain S-box-containing protein
VLIALLVFTAVIALGPQHAWPVQPGPYAIFPLLIWAALRFGPSGAATSSLILAAVALWNAALGVGPFASAGTSGLEVAVQVYVYLTVACLTSLIPAAVLRERRAAELHLHSSEDRYRELFEANPQPTMVYDLETLRFLAVNQAAVEKYGYSREEFRSLTIKDIRPAEDVPALLERVSHPRRPERIEGQPWRHCRKDGSVMEVEVLSSAIEFDGQDARLVLVNDVTERRRTEATLRNSEERFRQMAEHIQEAFYVIDLVSMTALYISPTWATIWGRPIEDARDPFIWLNSIHPDDQAAMSASQAAVARGETAVLTFRVIHPDGSVRWVLGRSFPVRDDTGRVYRMVGVASDTTEIRQVQEQFVQAQKMEAVGRLAGGVAHDFNNLLTVILSWTAILLERRGQDGAEREMLTEIESAGERAAGLTRQLLAFSRKQVLAPRVLDMNALIADTEKLLRRLIGEDIDLRTVLVPALGTALADPGQVEQVIMNLVVNARDAMPNGGTLTIETANADMRHEPVHLGEGPRAARYVMVAVGDTGAGMDAETQAHLFEPFFTTKGVGKGTGLGLATVYGIVQQSGGFIRVESEAGAGTTFRLYWPEVERVAVVKESASGPHATLRGTETVLVVEDDEQIRNLSRTILTARGYLVLVAENGEHALTLAAEHEGAIHLMLTDVIMPGMSGRELADRLNAAHPAMRVLYASGYTDEMIAHHGVLEPGVAFLQKPFTPGNLAQRVRDVLDAEPRPG